MRVRSTPLGSRLRWWRGSRSRILRGLVALALALTAASVVAAQSRRATDTLTALGTRRPVAVASQDIEPGDPIGHDDVTVLELPLAAIPQGAIPGGAVADQLEGRVATARMLAGEIVNRARISPEGVVGLAALVPTGRRGISVPRPADGAGLQVRVGDLVDILSPSDGGGGSGRALVVAQAARVIAVDPGAVTIAVTVDEAPAVAAAVGQGIPVLALTDGVPDPSSP
jgi:Flp pilus assembly protein CpaB